MLNIITDYNIKNNIIILISKLISSTSILISKFSNLISTNHLRPKNNSSTNIKINFQFYKNSYESL
jgi:hypothetical protein